ncbi:pentapeptide repeat-containing protein [Rothia mucilaginosa]|uniref:pentapeptide repeat-containing protein n=1 Tax=Rothia mucilaginosa TaxID=43675 RepID=UPI0026EE70DA|nr:pentapeptide repeat-containing protein [Rothia mucilaginosa]
MSPKSASRDKQAIRRLICKIIALILIPIIVFFAISYIESLSDRQIADLLEIFNFSKFGIPFNSALTVFLLLLFGLFAFFPLIRLIQNFFSALTGKYFVISLATLAVLGAVAALYIPSYTNWFKPDTQQSTGGTQPTQNGQGSGNQQNQPSKDPSSDLRLHLLYITGGIIAVLGLIETNRKNSQDHIRQVHAARRDRYIEAVDKLSSKQAPVRLGGVYALVGLVDEWLDDGNIDEETQIEEGQIIINNLCAYIRSPFPLAEKIEEYEAHEELVRLQKTEPEKLNKEESLQLQVLLKRFENTNDYKKPKDITTAYAKFREEQNVRRTIFVEMSKRSSPFTKDEKGKIIETTPGYWSDFWFDFSQAPIFYPLERLIIEDGSFAHIKFYADASFFETIFIRAADFSNAEFADTANFSNTEFADTATFRWATFADTAKFSGAKFNGANFSDVDFSSDTYFGGVTFTRKAIFVRATFSGIAHFSGAAFSGIANFSEATFTGNAVFVGATFTGTTNFGEANFISSAPKFNDIHKRTKFSARTSPNKYIFTVAPGTITIERKPATLLGKTFMIPYGSVLFDPRSLDKKTGEYTRVSDPAQ